jgi:hypothetical protein
MIENLTEMALKLKEEVVHSRKDNEILKIKMETTSASERPCVAYVQDSLTRRDVTSSAAPKNNGMKRHKDALSAGCVSLPRNLQLSADFMIDRNVTSQACTAPGTLKNGNDVAVAADDGFTTVKSANAKKEISSTSSVF